MTATRRLTALAAATTLFAGGSAMLLGGTAYADAATGTNDNRYSLVAEGDGMFAYIYNGLLPAVPYVDASAYTAEAENNSQGNSTAFAGLPYPGKTGTTLPGTVNGLSGGNFPPLPPFPGYVSSSYPSSEESEQVQGPYLIRATSTATAAAARAGGGVSPNAGSTEQQVFSTANVIANPDGTAEAKATAGVDGVSVGPIDLLNVSSTMSITGDGKSKPKVVTSTNLGTIKVLGFTLGVDQDGFNVLGSNSPLPTKTILQQINSSLSASGFQIDVIPGGLKTNPANGETTATSAALRITETYDAPVAGPSQLIFTFARATATFVNVETGSDVVDGGTTGGDTGGTTGTVPDPSVGGGTTGDTTGSGVSPDPGLGTDPGTAPSDPTVGVGPPPPVVSDNGGGGNTNNVGNTGKPTSLGFSSAPETGTETWALYLVLVLAGVGVIGGQQLFRSIGVRLALREA
jgi:hypothetical protein